MPCMCLFVLPGAVRWCCDGELKVLLAWSANTVLVCFRGSTTAANWVADAMVSLSREPSASTD
jgi:hypothetical protein